MSETNRPAPEQPQEKPAPDNPYHIDHARERRLKNTFIVLIGCAFLLAAALLVLGFVLDATFSREEKPVTPPPAPQSTPARTQGQIPGTLLTSVDYPDGRPATCWLGACIR